MDFNAKCQAFYGGQTVFLLFPCLSPIDVTGCVHVTSFESIINESDNFACLSSGHPSMEWMYDFDFQIQ